MIGDVLGLIAFIQERKGEFVTKSALFKWDGIHVSGDDDIKLSLNYVDEAKTIWFYRVEPVEAYVFVYMPLIPALYVDYGMVGGDLNASADFFRFVATPLSTVMTGGAKNVKAEFIVVGYRPRDLLTAREAL